MEISGGWYQVRFELEQILDSVFQLNPNEQYEFDSLLSIEEINQLGYVRNFPHLTCLACSIADSQLNSFASGDLLLDRSFRSGVTDFALLPAACYKIYLSMRDKRFEQEKVLGCIAKCFRHEDKPLDAYRAINFTMKEFVCIGNAEHAQAHLKTGSSKISALLRALNIAFEYVEASDPFFDSTSSQAVLAKLMPTKQEFLFDGHAIASINFHRTYFGEKFNILFFDQLASTSCVAFGIERWISMLAQVFGEPKLALDALRSAQRSELFRELKTIGG